MREALKTCRQVYGDTHFTVSKGLNNLAVLLKEKVRFGSYNK